MTLISGEFHMTNVNSICTPKRSCVLSGCRRQSVGNIKFAVPLRTVMLVAENTICSRNCASLPRLLLQQLPEWHGMLIGVVHHQNLWNVCGKCLQF